MDRALPVQNKAFLIPDVGAMIQTVLYGTNSRISKEIGKPSTFALDVICEEIKGTWLDHFNFNNRNFCRIKPFHEKNFDPGDQKFPGYPGKISNPGDKISEIKKNPESGGLKSLDKSPSLGFSDFRDFLIEIFRGNPGMFKSQSRCQGFRDFRNFSPWFFRDFSGFSYSDFVPAIM